MTITFQGALIITIIIETILWIMTSDKSYGRKCEIEELKKDNEYISKQLKREKVISEEYRDMFCKKDNEVTLWQMKYKKCIEYIKKINEENKNK